MTNGMAAPQNAVKQPTLLEQIHKQLIEATEELRGSNGRLETRLRHLVDDYPDSPEVAGTSPEAPNAMGSINGIKAQLARLNNCTRDTKACAETLERLG